jgi:hypothetical protein
LESTDNAVIVSVALLDVTIGEAVYSYAYFKSVLGFHPDRSRNNFKWKLAHCILSSSLQRGSDAQNIGKF